MKRDEWLRLKRQIESLWVPELGMAIHHTPYSDKGISDARIWITLRGEIIWDFPRQFYGTTADPPPRGEPIDPRNYSYGVGDYQVIQMLRAYLDSPRDRLLDPFVFEYRSRWTGSQVVERNIDKWDLGDILRAADRRLGKRKLTWWALADLEGGSLGRKVLIKRFPW